MASSTLSDLVGLQVELEVLPLIERSVGSLRLVLEIDLANFRLTDSAYGWSSEPPWLTAVIVTSFSLTMRNSCCPLPALRWVIVASLMCSPVAHTLRSAGVALSMPCTIDSSWNVALPTPDPLPDPDGPAFATPQENESTSISSLCLASSDSPLMSPIFAKMFRGH
jgi:hypothetical protein